MSEQSDQIQARHDKLERLKSMGIDPYPYSYERSHAIAEVLEKDETFIASAERLRLAGRIVAFRRQGKTAFVNIKQDGIRLQLYVTRDNLEEGAYEAVKCLDIGDHIGAEGVLFTTKTGETTLKTDRIEVLCKSLRPLPIPKQKVVDGETQIFDEFKDVETRYRQRYADLALNDNVATVFKGRSKIVSSIRSYLEEQEFLEVETPTLQGIYGGANARPFVTHHNALDIPLYLRVSNELYLKRCLVGGFDRVFEFVKDFRNEGIDRTHSPEFTQLEFYQAYADYRDMMVHFENIYARACEAVNGSTKISYQGTEVDLSPPWERLSMKDAISKYAQIDIQSKSDEDLQSILKDLRIELQGEYKRGLAIAEIFEATCEEKLIQPVFITDHPVETTPLCKRHREDAALIERFEPYICGWEVGNAYSELNDPLLQRELLNDQVERGRGGEDETHPMDEDFLRAMEYGMPPAGGVGIGIDRMAMILLDQVNIRDVILFPLLRPE